jgi:hypothetical protein
MSFESRQNNVESLLQTETGHSLQDWRKYIVVFYSLLWTTKDREKAVKEFTFASAIYEWAAKDFRDDVLDTTDGSFGPFQAYAGETTGALKNDQVRQALELFLDDQNTNRLGLAALASEEKAKIRHLLVEFGKFLAPPPAGRVQGGLLGGPRIPGSPIPAGSLTKGPDPPVDDYWTPIVNVIGKIALSLHKAQLAKEANAPKLSPIWHLPDEVLIWVLLCYEGAGDEGVSDRAHQKNDLIKAADEAARTGGDPLLAFDFGSIGDRRRVTLKKLNISFKESCKYSELLIKKGEPPPWRKGETPPFK